MTNWGASNKKYTSKCSSNHHEANNSSRSGTALSSWSRQQKLATISSFAILGILLIASACSKQSAKPALVSVSSPASNSASTSPMEPPTASASTTTAAVLPTATKKVHKKRPANVTYSDDNYGVSFLYPRKFVVTSGDAAQSQIAEKDAVPMNFVQPGGIAVATVTLPANSYPGTDFASAFLNVNLNRSVSEQECSHFAFVDTRNADGEAVDAEKIKIGSTEMEMTSDFSANMMKQDERQYYHSYENGACYEYVLGLGTEGFATEVGIRHVDRDAVFAKLEKILATVKVKPSEPEHVAEQAISGIGGDKE
jgi:hypothetical protein